jgi:hypothetical protein
MVEREIEHVEIAQPPRGIDGAQDTVEQQRNALLGTATVLAQRRVQAGEIVPRWRRAEHAKTLGGDDDVA